MFKTSPQISKPTFTVLPVHSTRVEKTAEGRALQYSTVLKVIEDREQDFTTSAFLFCELI